MGSVWRKILLFCFSKWAGCLLAHKPIQQHPDLFLFLFSLFFPKSTERYACSTHHLLVFKIFFFLRTTNMLLLCVMILFYFFFQVYAYYRSLPMPITSHKFGSVDPISGQETTDNNEPFVSSVCWREKYNMVVAANSSGRIELLQMVWEKIDCVEESYEDQSLFHQKFLRTLAFLVVNWDITHLSQFNHMIVYVQVHQGLQE